MSDQNTQPMTDPSNTEPISRAENRVIGKVGGHADFHPRLVLAYRRLTAFVLNANEKKYRVKAEYDVPGVGTLRLTRAEDFHLTKNAGSSFKTFTLSCHYVGDQELKFVPENKDLYFKVRETLFDHGVEFRSAIAATMSKITVEPNVPVAVTISADIEGGKVLISLRNMRLFGNVDYEFPIESVDTDLVDAIEGLLLMNFDDFYRLAAECSAKRVGSGEER